MNIYDIVIIGGGIGGLHTAFKLSKIKKYKILLIDERKYLGGRILTYYEKNFNYELGAGRFNNKHKNLLRLINKFKLTKIELESDDQTKFLDSSKILKKNLFSKLIKKILIKFRNINSEILKKYTFKELCYKYYSKNKDYIKKIIKYFCYKSEFEVLNAFDAIKSFKNNFTDKNKFYILKEGLSKLCQIIGNECIKNGIEMKLNSKVTDIQKSNELFNLEINNKINIKTNKIIFALKKNDLLKFNVLNPIKKLLNSVKSTQLLRIYAHYPVINGNVWFSSLNKIVSDSILKFIIPINKKYGIIMISYTDYKDTQTFIDLKTGKIKNDKDIINIINQELKKIFKDIIIPDPIKINSYYWINGCHYWKKNYDSKIISKYLINPLNNIYICGEAYSQNQAWIEGALETSNKVCEKILI